MLSIGEAWELFGSLNRRMGKANAQASARALALAVLEEAMTDNGSVCADCYIDGDFWEWNKKSDHNCSPAALLARIEALGKEGASS